MVGLALVLFTWDLLRDGSSEVPPVAIWTSRLLRLTSIYYSFASHRADELGGPKYMQQEAEARSILTTSIAQ